MVSRFEFAGRRLEGFVGPVVEQRVGQWSADALVEEDEHERGLGPLAGEALRIAAPDAFQQTVGFHLAKVIAEPVEGVDAGAEAERDEDSLMDFA